MNTKNYCLLSLKFIALAFVLFFGAIMLSSSEARAEEFSLSGPSLELRTVQFCSGCGTPLRVGHIHEGEKLRCPKCDKIQLRLANRYLHRVVLQVCPACQKAFDVNNKIPNSGVICPWCATEQQVMPGATLTNIDPELRKKAVEAVLALRSLGGPPRKQEKIPGENISPPAKIPDRKLLEPADTPETEIPEQYEKMDYERERALTESERIAATVNGEAITESQLNERFALALEVEKRRMGPAAATPQGAKKIAEIMPALKTKCLDELVHETLVLQQARSAEIYIPENEIEAAAAKQAAEWGMGTPSRELRERVRRELMLKKILAGRAGSAASYQPSPAEVRSFYRNHRNLFTESLKVRIRCIVVYRDRTVRADKRKAEVIIAEAAELYQRGNSFSATAEKYSDGVFASRGGLFSVDGITMVSPSVFAIPLRLQLRDAAEGSLLGPINLGHALALVRLEKRAGGAAPPLDEVQADVLERMRHRDMAERIEGYLKILRSQADIQVYR